MALGSYIFDANTETPDTVARRRAIADALLKQSMQDSQPKSVMAAIGQGLGDLGEVLAYRRNNSRADEAETAGRASVGDLSVLFGGADDAGEARGPATGDSGAVLDATSGADMAPYQKALLDTIAGTESPGYNVMYGGGRFSDYSHHPNQAIPIRSGPNAGKTSSAAGRYQFLGSTWDAMAHKLGLTDFSPASQDKAAWALASETYRRKTGGDLAAALQSGDPRVIAGVGHALSGTWTSLPGGIEQGQGANRFVQAFNRYLGGAGQRPTQVASLDPSAGMDKAYPNTWSGDEVPMPPGLSKPQPYTSPLPGSDNDPTGLGQAQPMPPIQRVTRALQQAQGVNAAPASPAVQRVAQAMSQRARVALGILQNPWASDGQKAVASAVLKQEIEQGDPAYQLGLRKSQIELDQLEHPSPDYGFTSVGDNLVRTDKRTGDAIPVYQGKPKGTPKEQDYEYYAAQEKAQGRQPLSFGDWDVRNSKAGSSSVTVNNAGTTELQKLFAKRYDDISTQAQGAPDAIAKLDRMTALSKDPNFYSGTGAGTVQFFKQALAALGGDPNAAAPMEEFAALSNRAVLDTMGGSLGTGFSNADRDFVVSTVPALDATPQGNLKRIDVLRRINQRKIEIGKMADDYVMQNGQLDAGFNKLLSQYAETHPLFGDLSGQSGSQPQAPAAPAADGWKVMPNGVRIRVKP
jgi:muramidase (phage lysozyme)